MFGISYTKKLFIGIFVGIMDRTISRLTGKRIFIADFILRKLRKCEPWTNHLYDSALDEITSALKSDDFTIAKILLAISRAEDADANYISLLLSAIPLCAERDEVLINFIPFYYTK